MAQNNTQAASATEAGNNGYYQISDDDVDDYDDLMDDGLLEESEGPMGSVAGSGRGPYERAWTTDATRALIHIRGPMEGRFTEGRQKRTALWLHCTRQLQKLGYRYSAAKVQKKWHNILITYNKNLSKKYLSGYVHWEFFEEMFKYLQGKKADCEIMQHQQQQQHNPLQQQQQQHVPQQHQEAKTFRRQTEQRPQQLMADELSSQFAGSNQLMLATSVENDAKSNDEFDEDSTVMSELKQPKMECNSPELPLEISHTNGFAHMVNNKAENAEFAHILNDQQEDATWWKDYFERKLLVEREKIQCQKDMHRELMQFNKMSLVQQEKIERMKIDAINSLTCTLQKLVEAKNRKC